ncbi:ABC transporter permease [Spiroplasma turonicum]|uniref:Ribose/galactose ABC transporter permease n=1 Tax=Spiroplasma turonicum TaxID=216946 RepID=A0A0K1P5H7_9MOLU|nr:ABC transporter permease [Spiroplasma turonicum]AKU79561.1 ribose/galactose ABC transporter permease [Spiroplasma turonicum]ALX70584.1 ribose/galactose ABC transporter permease [Spiroplasma turonicum]
MKVNTKLWIKKQHFLNFFSSEKNKGKLGIIKASILSILFGLLIGIIIIFINGENGFQFIFSSIDYSLQSSTSSFLPKTINYFSTYALMGIGLALGFKIGIFNMGGTGQAVIGMALSVLAIGNKADSTGMDFKDVDNSFVIAVFFIFIFSGMAVSLISGILKVSFNIHEVVTTVMLNWIVWIFANWLFDRSSWNWSTNHTTERLNTNWLSIGDNVWIFGVILTIISVLILYILVNLTTFGYKFKVSGKQPTAAKYAGINMKYFVILTTALQGVFISLGGFIYYMTIELSLTTGKISELPSIGFDAIPIALVAFSNFFGILPVAFLWAILKNGSDIAKSIEFPLLSKDVSNLVFGAITYGAGISALFYKLNIYNYFYKRFFILYSYEFKKTWMISNSKLYSLRKQRLLLLSNKDLIEIKKEIKNFKINNKKTLAKDEYINSLSKLQINYKNQKKELKQLFSYNIKTEKENLNFIWENKINTFKTYSLKGYKKREKNLLVLKKYEILNKFILFVNQNINELRELKKEYRNFNLNNRKNKELILQNRLDYKNKKKMLISKMHEKSYLEIQNYNLYKKELLEKCKSNVQDIKDNLKNLNTVYKNKLLNTSKDKNNKKPFYELDSFKLKEEHYNKRIEVVKKYGI